MYLAINASYRPFVYREFIVVEVVRVYHFEQVVEGAYRVVVALVER
jgi:hypothetical protein